LPLISRTNFKEFHSLFLNELVQLRQFADTAYKDSKEQTKQLIKNRIERNTRRETQNLETLRTSWHTIWDGFRHQITKAVAATKRAVLGPKSDIETFIHELEEEIKQHIGPSQWEETGTHVSEELHKLEKSFLFQLKNVENRYEVLLNQVLNNINHETVHHAHAIMKCKACGNEYSFLEFLDLFDHEHNLALPTTDHYNDGSVEEYYEGWAEFVNRYKFHCPKCDATSWEDIVIYDEDTPKKVKDEL